MIKSEYVCVCVCVCVKKYNIIIYMKYGVAMP